MNRLLAILASIGLAIIAISSTCAAALGPCSYAASRSSAATGNGLSVAWPSPGAPSPMIVGGLLSL